MNTLYIILAVLSIPLVFFTLFSKSEKGQRIRLGSYYIIRNFTSRIFRVRSLDDKLLLALRLIFALIMASLVINPLELDTPAGTCVMHSAGPEAGAPVEDGRGKVRLDIPGEALDSFNEDIFFLKALAGNVPAGNADITIIYNPDSARLAKARGDIIVFPGPNQDRDSFKIWADIFYFSDMLTAELKLKDTEYYVKKYYRPVFTGQEKISVYSKLENDTAVAFSINDGSRRALIFSIGLDESWGDAGLSGHVMEIIMRFQKNLSLTEAAPEGELKSLEASGNAAGRLPYKTLLHIAVLFFILEIILFIYRSAVYKKSTGAAASIIFIFLMTSALNAGGFVFVELGADNIPDASNQLMFSRLKKEAELRTSVRIDPVYYKKISTGELASGRLPKIPYLWIIGCKGPGFFGRGVKDTLIKFMERGGIIFIDTCGKPDDSGFLGEINDFILERQGYDPEKGLLPRLPADHPVYKSFYLLAGGGFFGIDVSRSTRRTAMMVSRGGFKSGILSSDEMAFRTGINVLLYMLSGNYKSDQIHTRQILRKLKDRENFR